MSTATNWSKAWIIATWNQQVGPVCSTLSEEIQYKFHRNIWLEILVHKIFQNVCLLIILLLFWRVYTYEFLYYKITDFWTLRQLHMYKTTFIQCFCFLLTSFNEITFQVNYLITANFRQYKLNYNVLTEIFLFINILH